MICSRCGDKVSSRPENIDLVPPEKLIGREVTFVTEPAKMAQITAVTVTPGGRAYRVEWFDGDQVREYSCWGFQVQLREEGA